MTVKVDQINLFGMHLQTYILDDRQINGFSHIQEPQDCIDQAHKNKIIALEEEPADHPLESRLYRL